LSSARAPARLTSTLALLVASLLDHIVTAANFLAAGLGHAHAQIVPARSARWRHRLTIPADSGNIAVLDDDPKRRAACAPALAGGSSGAAVQLTSLRQTPPLTPLFGGVQRREPHLM